MAQQQLGQSSSGSGGSGSGDSCRSAVLAAMQVMEDECGDGKKLHEISDGHVVMMPKDVHDRKQQVDPNQMSKDEIERELKDSPWLDNWTKAMCQDSGIPEGSDAWTACRRNWARKALN